MRTVWLLSIRAALGVALALTACRSSPPPAADGPPVASTGAVDQAALNQGYSLLYGLVASTAKVDMILMLKSASDPVKQVIRQIATESATARDRLKEMAEGDPALQLDLKALPGVEQATRQRIESTTTKALLTASGENFERRLLITQLSGMEYGAALAQSLVQLEGNPQRREALQAIATRFDALHQRVFTVLGAM